jgi:hypothetical protein
MDIISRAEAKAQGLKRYFTGEPCKHDHVSERMVSDTLCLFCKRIREARQWKQKQDKKKSGLEYKLSKEWDSYFFSGAKKSQRKLARQYFMIFTCCEYRKRQALGQKKYRDKNIKTIAKKRKDKYWADIEKNRAYARIMSNKQSYRETRNKRNLVTRRSPDMVVKVFMQNSLRSILNRSDKRKTNKSEVMMNYKKEDLIFIIESKFIKGMDWGNRNEWHIDHIKPIAQFLKEGITDPAIINALSNLQPLWAKDNLSKGAKYNETN